VRAAVEHAEIECKEQENEPGERTVSPPVLGEREEHPVDASRRRYIEKID
jgi:hypothetical protein